MRLHKRWWNTVEKASTRPLKSCNCRGGFQTRPYHILSTLIIRKAHPEDIFFILTIEESSYKDPWDECAFMDAISDSMPHSHLWVAMARDHPHNADSLMGYICFHWLKDELYIVKLTTSPIHRRKGIASFLLGLAVLWAKRRNGKRVILDVDLENIPAQNLYKRFGFRKIGPSGKKAWIMELGLDHYLRATT